jgi:hypothetical protein
MNKIGYSSSKECHSRPPFRNVAIMADNDRMYHRIGPVGEPKRSFRE